MHPDRPSTFDSVLDDRENVLWFDRPNWTVFLSKGIPFALLGIGWGILDYQLFLRHQEQFDLGLSLFFIAHLAPLWLGLLNLLRLALAHGNTAYALTDRRLLLRGGFWGTDFQSVRFEQLAAVEVQVNPLESSMGLGTLNLRPRMVQPRSFGQMVGISNAYEVFRQIEQAIQRASTTETVDTESETPKQTGFGTKYDISRNA